MAEDDIETSGKLNELQSTTPIDFYQIVEFGDACLVLDREYRFQYLNPQMERLTGYSKSDLLHRTLWEMFPESVGSIFQHQYERAFREQVELTFEAPYAPHDRWYEVRCKPFQSGLMIVFRDISARKRAQRELAERESHLAVALQKLTFHFENTPLAVIEWDHQFRTSRWSPQAESLFGWRGAEVMGKTIEEWPFIMDEDMPFARALIDELISGRAQRSIGRKRTRRSDGTIVHCRWHNSVLLDPAGNLTSLLSLVEDVTESVTMAQRQRQFLREMLFALTEARMLLCDSADDLPAALPRIGEPVPLTPPTLRILRRRVQMMVDDMEFDPERSGDIITAVGEASMNAVVHGGGGEGWVCADRNNKKVQVWITDRGRGISEEMLHRAMLERGFTTAGTLGHGFSMILKTVDKLYLLTGSEGTTVVLEQNNRVPEPEWLISAGLKKWEAAAL